MMHYPASLEAKRHLPWTVSVTANKIFLHSRTCNKTVPLHSGRPCLSCRSLHSHSIVEGIRDRNEKGASEKTNWIWLTYAHLCDALLRKNKQIDGMRLNALNTSRKLLSRMRNLEGWKHLVHAISQSNTPRIQVAVSVALKAGSGFRSALEMIDKAARHVYRPQSYQEADYHRAFLIWKLGGAAAARIAHRALGLPSLDTAGRHIMTHPIRGSALFPTSEEIEHNLSSTISASSVEEGVTLGVSIMIDEIKNQERLRWEAVRNLILGLCREHSGHCVVEFHSMVQADFILSELQSKNIHMASEVGRNSCLFSH